MNWSKEQLIKLAESDDYFAFRCAVIGRHGEMAMPLTKNQWVTEYSIVEKAEFKTRGIDALQTKPKWFLELALKTAEDRFS